MNPHYKKILTSILIGAIVAFLSSLFDGLLEFLQNHGNNIVGSVSATMTFLIKKT